MLHVTTSLTSARHESKSYAPTVWVGGLETVRLSRSELAARMVADCLSRGVNSFPKLVFSSNGQCIALAMKDPGFRHIMAQADIIHADGMPVVMASKLLTRHPLPERVATTDFFHDAAAAAARNGLSFYIFGGSESQNGRAVAAMERLHPNLMIAGRRNGFFREEEEEEICQDVRSSGADVLWVGLGKPLQEFWSVRNRGRLRGIGWIKTCGGLYGHLSGDEIRAPTWIQAIGLEWLFRAVQDPKRLAMRYLITNSLAIYSLIRYTK